MRRFIVITGTDTGVGKTVLTALLASHLRAGNGSVAALKPICSGGRDDAHVLHRALGGTLTLDEINPWHFRAALAPLLAARRENKQVPLSDVVAHVQSMAQRFDTVLVEGAGGLLAPLGEGFSTRDLIAKLGANVFVVAKNQLGVVNQVRLTLEALPPIIAACTRVVLMSPAKLDTVSRTNPELLREFVTGAHVSSLPWFRGLSNYEKLVLRPPVRDALAALLH